MIITCVHVYKTVSNDGDFVCTKCGREFCATPYGIMPRSKK